MLKLSKFDFFANPNFSFALSSKIKWSKNMMEEREVPEQVILGSMDPLVCPLLNLAVYLEYCLFANPTRFNLLFGSYSQQDLVRRYLDEVFKDEWFNRQRLNGPVGTHSLRKEIGRAHV